MESCAAILDDLAWKLILAGLPRAGPGKTREQIERYMMHVRAFSLAPTIVQRSKR